MQIEFTNCTITAVSKPYVYDNPQSMKSTIIYNITVCCQEVDNEGQTAMVGYGLSYSKDVTNAECGFKRGDVVDIVATMRGRWNSRFQRTENDMYIDSIAYSNAN